MARKRASQSRAPPSDSSSDSEGAAEAVHEISAAVYQQLSTAAAIRRPCDFAVACGELAQLARHLFRRCSKEAQARVVEDMGVAIEACDG